MAHNISFYPDSKVHIYVKINYVEKISDFILSVYVNLKRRDHLRVLHVYGRIMLKMVLRKQEVKLQTEFIWLRIRSRGGPYEHCNEPLDSTKGGKFLDEITDYQILKKNSTAEAIEQERNPLLRKSLFSFMCKYMKL